MVDDGNYFDSNLVLKGTEPMSLAEGGLSQDVGLALDVGALCKKINTSSSPGSRPGPSQDTDANEPVSGFLSKKPLMEKTSKKRKSGMGPESDTSSKSNSDKPEIQENAKVHKKINTELEPPKFYEGCEYRCKICGESRGSVEHIRNHIRKSHKVSQCSEVMYEALAIDFAWSLSQMRLEQSVRIN
jgi:hypothetical protein